MPIPDEIPSYIAAPPGQHGLEVLTLSLDSSGYPAAAAATVSTAAAPTAAVLPLICADGLVGAIWLARHGAACSGGGGAATSILWSPAALQQLALCSSLALLGGDGAQRLAELCDSVQGLASAASLQQLLSSLSDGAAQRLRHRFLMDPRVAIALVPEPSATAGLMLSWGAAGSAAAAAAAAVAAVATTAPSLPLPLMDSKRSRLNTPVGGPQVPMFPLGSSEGRAAPAAEGSFASTVAGGARLLAGRAAALISRDAANAPRDRAVSDSAPQVLRAHHGGGGDAAAPGEAAGRLQSARSASRGVPRVIALSPQLMSLVDATAVAQPGGLPSGRDISGVGVARLASAPAGPSAAVAPCVALTVKPFPLAHTLLRRVVKGVTEAGSVPERPVAVAVEDVVAHLQDPRKPSRDIMLLLAAASRGTGAGGGGGSGVSASALLRTSSRDPPGHAGALSYRTAAFLADGGGGSDSGGHASRTGGGGSGGGARGVASVVLMVLPAGDGRGLFGLYAMFPQQLPLPLLRAVRSCLLELGRVAAPLVQRKLLGELGEELKTLSTGTPGSYAVLEPPSFASGVGVSGGGGDSTSCNAATLTEYFNIATTRAASAPFLATGDLTTSTPSNVLATAGAPSAMGRRSDAVRCFLAIPECRDGAAATSGSDQGSARSFLLDSRAAGSGAPPVTAPGDVTTTGGGGGMLGTTDDGRWPGLLESKNSGLQLAGGGGGVGGDGAGGGGGLALSVLSRRMSAMCLEEGSRSTTVIHVEELDPVRNTMRAQMPILVASLASSINSARLQAAVAAVTASPLGGRPRSGAFASASTAVAAAADGGGGDRCDLAQLELHKELGRGGCAVVLKGVMGTLDCAVKLMEMPEVDNDGDNDDDGGSGGAYRDLSVELDSLAPTPSARTLQSPAIGGGGGGSEDNPAAVRSHLGGGAARPAAKCANADAEAEACRRQLAARRALLRNAMELAAMSSISHPNIMQAS
ncbi:hypothetical protein GPECTOR_47g356 [Gonium pectorale]|uniref:Protein kinase domain-containing protein n=1 Tax=Gonium pectorale TaxID=33097 RepID=A0A150G9Q9_GONPE|nr:hypothetical protein GPECTOR_47g356 [Gonium pectorale]|eukprot:KXZ46080.1 hypothetical protein GPECTOR_47g356 [Gonium pectorale]